MHAVFRKVAIRLTPRDRILARDETARRSVLDLSCNRSRTGDVKSVGGRQCSRSEIGSQSSACPSTCKCFAENRIDFSVLPDLTDQHLKDLGLPLGDRLKMLRAIRELSDTASEPPQPEQTLPRHRRTPSSDRDVLRPCWLHGAVGALWTLKTSARSFRPIRSALRRPWAVSAVTADQ